MSSIAFCRESDGLICFFWKSQATILSDMSVPSQKTTHSWKSKDTLPQNPPFCSKHKHHPEKTIKLVFPMLINLVLLLNFMGIIKNKPVD